MTKTRLDQLVFEKGFAESRERAKALVMSGQIFLNGHRADKPGMQVDPQAEVELHGSAPQVRSSFAPQEKDPKRSAARHSGLRRQGDP